jgi:hypothetical protein
MKINKESVFDSLKQIRSIIERIRTKEGVKLPITVKDYTRDFLKDYLDHLDDQNDTDETNLIKLSLLSVNKGNEVVVYIYPTLSDIKTDDCLFIEDNLYNLSQIITTLEAEYNHR